MGEWMDAYLDKKDDECSYYREVKKKGIVEIPKEMIESLLVKINGITASHRHGLPISKKKLDSLSNYQIEVEKYLNML